MGKCNIVGKEGWDGICFRSHGEWEEFKYF